MKIIELPRRKILVVDDTRAAAYVLGRLLETIGQTVVSAFEGSTALEIAQRERPDVVISDIAMPGMDGYELARRLREDESLKNTVLVALTGFGQDSDRQMAKEAGFDFHLVKPVSLEALQDFLKSLPAPSHASRPDHSPRSVPVVQRASH